MQRFSFLILICFCVNILQAQKKQFTHADTLRGSITPQRAWWNVTFYDLHVRFNLSDSSIIGYNAITYKVIKEPAAALVKTGAMQIDLMTPLQIDSIMQDGKSLSYHRDGNAFFVNIISSQKINQQKTITVYYHGQPRVAKLPPWDNGVTWKRDSLGNAWIATTCQGVGASIWWPNKDTQADEPDSQCIAITVPDTLTDISNGRLSSKVHHADSTTTFEWFVKNPINNYDVAANIGKYAHYTEIYNGLNGKLTMDFYPLPYHLQKAKKQFQQAISMMKCFEYWFGPYPWYKDGYKLVETPYLGMEHQSCVGYGNNYENGYRGRDLSGTGWGVKWDFIIVHESAHEWFGNNITSKDIADMWVHEAFANYAESLYTECLFGKKAGDEYEIGCRKNVQNDRPVISHYNVNEEGSEDMYYKGGNMLHTIRQIINNDKKWGNILRGLNKTFWHQTVTGQQIENYISQKSGIDFSKVFKQYLTTTMIPVLEYKINKQELSYRWNKVVKGFNMPVKVTVAKDKYTFIYPTTEWKQLKINLSSPDDFKADENFYVEAKKL